jgi:predicted amidohydrolase
MQTMEEYVVTAGQLVLSSPQDVYDQINTTLVENPETALFVFPEFATQDQVDLRAIGYLQGDAEAQGAARKRLDLVPDFSEVKALSDRLGKAIVTGCLAQDHDQLFSRAYFYDPQQQQLAFYDKSHVHWTEGFLRPGTSIEPIQTRFGKIGLLVCYDMAFAEAGKVHGIKGAEVLLAVSAIPKHFQWKYAHYRMIGAAIYNQYYVVAAHLGYTRKAPMGGYSGIYGPEGDLVAQINGTDFGHISARIDLGQVRLWREKERINPYRQPHLYETITAAVGDK